MPKSWSVRMYKEGDKLGILELMKLAGIERTAKDWSWEYENNPFNNYIGVAEQRGQIIGHMALIPMCMKVGEDTLMGSQAVDLVVHPDFRRQGIFLDLGRTLMEKAGKMNVDTTYGFPNTPAQAGHLKYGWFNVCQVPIMIKPINIDKVVGLLKRHSIIRFLSKYKLSRDITANILNIALSTYTFFFRIFNPIGGNDNLNITLRTIESFDVRFDDFWKKVSKEYEIIVVRNKQYINWRYLEKPNAKYIILSAEKNNEIMGYIILRIRNEKNLKFGYIADILGFHDSKMVLHSLILKALAHFKKENVDAIFCWMLNNLSGGIYYKTLRYNGFFPVSSIPLIARTNSSRIPRKFLEEPSKWYVTMGDSDHI